MKRTRKRIARRALKVALRTYPLQFGDGKLSDRAAAANVLTHAAEARRKGDVSLANVLARVAGHIRRGTSQDPLP